MRSCRWMRSRPVMLYISPEIEENWDNVVNYFGQQIIAKGYHVQPGVADPVYTDDGKMYFVYASSDPDSTDKWAIGRDGEVFRYTESADDSGNATATLEEVSGGPSRGEYNPMTIDPENPNPTGKLTFEQWQKQVGAEYISRWAERSGYGAGYDRQKAALKLYNNYLESFGAYAEEKGDND